MMNKAFFLIYIIIYLFVGCTDDHSVANSCIEIKALVEKFNNSKNYKLDSINYSAQKLSLKIRLLKMDFYVPQVEREFIFYSLSNAVNCKNSDLDSAKILLVADSITDKNMKFLFDYKTITTELEMRDSINSFCYYKSISYLMNRPDYRSPAIILIAYFGDVIHHDVNLMHNDVDFFEFLMNYSNDVKRGEKNAKTYDLLNQLQQRIMSDSGLNSNTRNEALDFINFLRNFQPKTIV